MNKNIQIELIVFIDYTIKIARNGRHILNNVVKHYGDTIKLKFQYFSNDVNNAEFQLTTRAVLTAKSYGKLHEMDLLLMDHKGDYTPDIIYNMVESLGIDIKKFKKDYNSPEITTELKNNIKLAKQNEIKVVPAVIVNGNLYNGAWDEHALIEYIEYIKNRPVAQAMESFVKWGASAALMLLIAAIVALIFANIGFIEEYEFLRDIKLGFSAGDSNFLLPLETWINDGLMAIFFLLIGLEIKRELIFGELSSRKKATMPVIGAIGGMIIPALIYLFINYKEDGAHGWGVPMATDIAFTLGLMALLGSTVPGALKAFISALAVSDDLGAILVIALFYGHGFHINAFIVSVVIVAIMGLLNYSKVYSKTIYIVLGVFLWFYIYQSGLHATLAGVITAILIPSRRKGNLVGIATQASVIFEQEIVNIKDLDNSQESIRHSSLQSINKAINRLTGPGEELEHSLEKGVNYLILPLFAFFNTGIVLLGVQFNVITPVNLGIILGLCIGKPLGIVGFCWLASKFDLATLSNEISWAQLIGAACLAGVGFTMSIVVAGAVFDGAVLNGAKLSILIASALSATIGLFILQRAIKVSVIK
ncbi:sodium/proton antiporter, NhaA family [Flavobacterium micromati]|uniref:Na(+)/H(+) antiporter NhaA n=1 Tax=Flavobacterium micromati TaxID=229205 RepID=A0A1M5N3Y8_9FLAO|nr:Na+/H+ antiporter NhaA [Flavobacterium micromati]SHG84268.1 sodium/proton antiporter, NhaA family [Flavobacterium micromati]